MMMKILVTAAGKHGSTMEISMAIARALNEAGHEAEAQPVVNAPAPAGYDAVIIGSAIYAGQWMKAARRYVETHQERLRQIPVWLFSSGPLGDDPQPLEEISILPELLAQSGARGHQLFVGSLQKADLNFGEKIIVKMVKAPYGDFRDWEAISAWSAEVAAAL
jgi:menaquinone-dependent protoporphyrinogen oxidase